MSFFSLPHSFISFRLYLECFTFWPKNASNISSAATFQHQAATTEFVSHLHSKFFLLILFLCIRFLVCSVHSADHIWVVLQITISPYLCLQGPSESWPSETAIQLVRTEAPSTREFLETWLESPPCESSVYSLQEHLQQLMAKLPEP